MSYPQTKIYKLKDHKLSGEEIAELGNILKAGQIIVFPTETVYGLGCLYSSISAKKEIFEIKERHQDRQLPVMAADVKSMESDLKCKISAPAADIMRKFMPGPVTVILNCENENSIGLRIPDSEFVLDLISVCSGPLAVTSANLSGEEAAVDFEEVYRLFLNKVAAIVDGGRCRLGKPSTIIDLRGDNEFKIVREGVYEENIIRAAAGNPKNVLLVCTGNSCRSVMAMAVLKKELEKKGIAGIEVDSTGVCALEGMRPTGQAIEVLREADIEISGYRAKMPTPYMLKKAELILVMERKHMDYILEIDGDLKRKTFGFLKFALGLDEEIEDPIGKNIDKYREVFSLIKEATSRIIKKIT